MVDGADRGHFDDYEWAERALERITTTERLAQPYHTREVQNGNSLRFTLARFTTLSEARSSAEAYSTEWGVMVEVVELSGVTVRTVATYYAGLPIENGQDV